MDHTVAASATVAEFEWTSKLNALDSTFDKIEPEDENMCNISSMVYMRNLFLSVRVSGPSPVTCQTTLQRCVQFSVHQCGYREHNSTLSAISVHKEVSHAYCGGGSTVFACIMDLSQAFERVCNKILLKKKY